MVIVEHGQLVSAGAGALHDDRVRQLRNDFAGNPANRIAQNGVARVGIDEMALNHQAVVETPPSVSHLLDDWAVTNQKRTGRCWMFAGLNLFRVGAAQKMGLKEFEFSQNYTLFWDKLERANYFLEAIIETIDRSLDDRTVAFLLSSPVEDGGQWNMFVNIVRKYGVVPKEVMPETQSSSETMRMNSLLRAKLREGAKMLRDLHAAGAATADLRATKDELVGLIFRMLCIHLGTPPERFSWQWHDRERTFHRDGELTPLEFAERYITIPIDDYVCLVNDPRSSSPYGRTFTVDYLGNIMGGEIVTYLNLDVAKLKEIARQTIESGEPVWFGCDVGKQMSRDLGLWDTAMFEYGAIYGTEFGLDKASRLDYHQTLMTHAMLFTGVDIVDDRTRRWRVENSWGDENGQKGFFTMNDAWFDEYVFEIAARKDRLSPELQEALSAEPIVLPAWDPMGALAGK